MIPEAYDDIIMWGEQISIRCTFWNSNVLLYLIQFIV